MYKDNKKTSPRVYITLLIAGAVGEKLLEIGLKGAKTWFDDWKNKRYSKRKEKYEDLRHQNKMDEEEKRHQNVMEEIAARKKSGQTNYSASTDDLENVTVPYVTDEDLKASEAENVKVGGPLGSHKLILLAGESGVGKSTLMVSWMFQHCEIGSEACAVYFETEGRNKLFRERCGNSKPENLKSVDATKKECANHEMLKVLIAQSIIDAVNEGRKNILIGIDTVSPDRFKMDYSHRSESHEFLEGIINLHSMWESKGVSVRYIFNTHTKSKVQDSLRDAKINARFTELCTKQFGFCKCTDHLRGLKVYKDNMSPLSETVYMVFVDEPYLHLEDVRNLDYNKLSKKVREELKQLAESMLKKGVDATEVAERLGMSESTVSRVKNDGKKCKKPARNLQDNASEEQDNMNLQQAQSV